MAAGADRRMASFRSQMVAPEFFALDATNRAIGKFFLGHAVVDDMDRKSAAQVAEHAKSFHRLASGAKAGPPSGSLASDLPDQFPRYVSRSPWSRSAWRHNRTRIR